MSIKCTLVYAACCALVLLPRACLGQESANRTTADDQNVQQHLRKLTEEVVAAEVLGDMHVLDRLYADNYIHMHENGLVENGDTHKRSLVSSGVRKYKAADISQTQVYLFGTGAIVSGHENWEQPKGISQHLFVAFWVQEQGAWRLAAWVAKPVPKTPGPTDNFK